MFSGWKLRRDVLLEKVTPRLMPCSEIGVAGWGGGRPLVGGRVMGAAKVVALMSLRIQDGPSLPLARRHVIFSF